mgnify:CR=1 FL=1
MQHTLKYIFSFCFLMLTLLTQAQETTAVKQKIDKKNSEHKIPESPKQANTKTTSVKTDTVLPVKQDRYGLRVGVDLYKLTRGLYDENYKGIELVGDYRLTKKHFLAAELGSEDKTTEDDRLNTTTKGTYLKVGFDYNAYQNWLDMENIISAGLRGGFSTFSQELNSYKIYNPHPYFGQSELIDSGKKYDGLTASWAEVAAGVNVKVFNNIYVGFNLQLKMLVTNSEPGNFENLYIPGFNRTYDGNFGAGFNYSISYFIPFYKSKGKSNSKISKPKL